MSFSGTKGYITKPKPGVMLNPLHPLSRGLVGYWLFNEGAGSRAYDISGHSNHGTLIDMSPNTHGSGWGGSKFGGGLQFDGVDDYVNVPDDPVFDNQGDFTLAGWIYLKTYGIATTYENQVMCKDVGAERSYKFFVRGPADAGNTGKLFFTYVISSDTKVSSSGTVGLDAWHHVAITFNNSAPEYIFYIDGIPSGSGATDITPVLSDAPLRIGGGESVDEFIKSWDGSIDLSHMYNQAKSPAEIKQLYHNPFCILLQVPIRRYYVAAPPGVTIPVFMNHYNQLARA